jgi:uncharacterized protein (TIGR02996 family)
VETGDDLLRAVLANPDDSALRGVYADWLEERGDPRGEFLRIAQRLAALPRKAKRRGPLVARLEELRPVIDPAWRALVELRLPADLVEFLAAGKQLEMDPDDYDSEAGAVTLVPLAELKLERFPVETGSLPVYEQDPHYPEVNSYLVLGVNLVASCTGDYEPVGLLMWLPVEKRNGVWDSSHCGIQVFGPKVTWKRIAADPAPHIDAGWTGINRNSPPTEELVPWPAHPYHDEQVYKPQPA